MVKLFGRTFFEKIQELSVLSADHVRNGRMQEDKGLTSTSQQWTDRIPHPNNMGNYEKWAQLIEVNGCALTITRRVTTLDSETQNCQPN